MLLMAAVRNVPIVCFLYCFYKVFVSCNLAIWILTISLFYQARPTLYQVVKEMIDKMGYEV